MDEENISKGEVKRDRVGDAIRRKRQKKIGIGILVLLALGGAVYGLVTYSRNSARDLPGQSFPNQGQEHVALDKQFSYNSNPPTSGPHYASPANWGVYDYEVNDKIFIHNLEHGGVWISYKPSVGTSTVDALRAIADELSRSKIVMAPRASNDTDIAVAAWTRLLKIDLSGSDITEPQLQGIRAFYRAYKNRGPEFVPDTMPGVDPKQVQ